MAARSGIYWRPAGIQQLDSCSDRELAERGQIPWTQVLAVRERYGVEAANKRFRRRLENLPELLGELLPDHELAEHYGQPK